MESWGVVCKYLKDFCILVRRTLGLFCLALGTMILPSRMFGLRSSIGGTGFRWVAWTAPQSYPQPPTNTLYLPTPHRTWNSTPIKRVGEMIRYFNFATDPSNNARHLETDNDSRVATILGVTTILKWQLLVVSIPFKSLFTVKALMVGLKSWLGHPRSSTRSRTRAFK